MSREKTDILSVIRRTPALFAWGKVLRIHDVGLVHGVLSAPYTIVEYRSTSPGDPRGSIRFHVYVDAANTNTSCESFDEAMLYAIGHKRLGVGDAHRMSAAAGKLLGVTS